MAIKYTSSEGSYIGYCVTGSGGRNIVYVPGAYSNLAIERYIPASVAWEKFLGKFGRLVTFDKRGTGVSDRTARPLNLDQQVVDVEAVRVASDSQDFVVCGLSQGAPLAVLYALAYPERVRALVLMEGVCCDAADPYKPLSDDNTLFDWTRTLAEFDADYEGWCKSRVRLIEPNSKPEDLDLSVEYMQATASPAAHRFIWCCLMGFDIRPMLRHITQPALVVHTSQDKLYPVEHGRYMAEHIPGAQYVELPSDSHMPMYDQSVAPQLFDAISKFVEKLPDTSAAELSERFVSTILFTDIVSSTDQQRTHGDSVWTKRISEFEGRSAAIVKSCRGRLAGSTGDGIFASFDVPGDGLRAACLLIEDAQKNNHPIRAGVHTGEVQRSRNGLHGLAVTMAARVADQAGKDEVLVTNVTQGIVEGGEFKFLDCGEVELKGLGSRRLAKLVR